MTTDETLYPESVVLHNAAIHHALRREINRIAAHAAAEDRTLRWVADELVDALATNPYPDGSPADEIDRLTSELDAAHANSEMWNQRYQQACERLEQATADRRAESTQADNDELDAIAVHRDRTSSGPYGLAVFAWCVTCNAREAVEGRPVESVSFARGSTGLAEVVKAAREHLASDTHLGRPWATIGEHATPDGARCMYSGLTTSQRSGDVCACGTTPEIIAPAEGETP